jgi:predicted ATPase
LRQSHERGLLKNTGLLLNGELVQLGTAQDILFEGAKEDAIKFELELENSITGTWTFKYNRERDVISYVIPPEASEILTNSLFNDNFQYIQAERLGPRTSSIKSEFFVEEHRQLGSRGEYMEHFLTNFGREEITQYKLLFPGSDSSRLDRQVEAWLGKISPNVRLYLNDHHDIDLISLQIAFSRKNLAETNRYRATNVGFGIRYVLPVIIALLSTKPGGLVLLENPEAHLHPQGQRYIGELIARAAASGIQVIVETHSDHVLNGIRLAVHGGLLSHEVVQLHFFQRIQDNEDWSPTVISPQIDRNGRLDKWPEGFFDEWDKSLEVLLSPAV